MTRFFTQILTSPVKTSYPFYSLFVIFLKGYTSSHRNYLINLFVTGFFGALGVMYFFRLLCREGVVEGIGTGLSMAFAFATLNLPYSTQLWGHVTALSFLVISLFYLLADTNQRWLAMSGLFAGLAISVDYLSIVVVALFLLCGIGKHGPGMFFFLVGLAFPLGCLGLYFNRCFGSPWMFAPDADVFELVAARLSKPSVDRVFQLLAGGFRGLFVHMPVLLLAPWGFFFWFRRKARDPLLWICLFSIVALLVVNASMVDWHGGRTVAARYQIISILFWVLPLKELKYDGIILCMFVTLVFVSLVNMIAIAAVSPLCVAGLESPYFGCVIPRFFAGEFNPYVLPPRLFALGDLKDSPQIKTAWNIGMLTGLKGFLSLIPLILVEILLALLLIRKVRDRGKS